MANVLNKTTSPADYRQSVHTPDYDPAAWFINPDISAVVAVPTKYWVVGTNPVTEMSQAQKDAVEAAIVAAALAAAKSSATGAIDGNGGYNLRAIAELVIDEINTIRQRLRDQDTAVSGAGTLAALKTSWASTATSDPMPARTLAQAKTAYKNAIAGTALDE